MTLFFSILIIFIFSKPVLSEATFQIFNSLHLHNDILAKRDCENPCGWSGQLCCEAGQICYTNSNDQAQCGIVDIDASGTWEYYTSTWTEVGVVTRTSIWSSYIPVAVATALTCNYARNESPCGSICCTSSQYCLLEGQCADMGDASSTYLSTLFTDSLPTVTVPFQNPVATDVDSVVVAEKSSESLSSGAIAGIVIGILAGVFLLLFLCLFCCFRAAFNGILAAFGFGKRQRRRGRQGQIRRTRHSQTNEQWYGRHHRPEVRPERESTFRRFGGFAGRLAAGMKPLDKRQSNTVSSVSYASSGYISRSSSSRSRNRSRNRSRLRAGRTSRSRSGQQPQRPVDV